MTWGSEMAEEVKLNIVLTDEAVATLNELRVMMEGIVEASVEAQRTAEILRATLAEISGPWYRRLLWRLLGWGR